MDDDGMTISVFKIAHTPIGERRGRIRADGSACPHVDRDDTRCCNRFSLGRLDQTYAVCFGTYHGCPMFHRINGELARVTASVSPPAEHSCPIAQPAACAPTVLTIHAAGREPLRATGT
jgi:hypothetical protein